MNKTIIIAKAGLIIFIAIMLGLPGTNKAFGDKIFDIASCDDGYSGIVLADDQGNIIYSQNKNKLFIPASTLKILTSLAAIHTLGEHHRFKTAYFFDEKSSNLYIKGFGDPLMISEIIKAMCQDIVAKTKITKINNIILDQTYFSKDIVIPGKSNSLNPYDAHGGALCANFNTIMFKWDTEKNGFISAEPQTPLLSIFYDDIENSKLKKGRIIISKQESFFYPGYLIKYFLEKENNIKIAGTVIQGKFKDQNKLINLFFSPFELKEVVQKLLAYSNNFIANQLLLAVGAKIYAPPATIEKGVDAVKKYSCSILKIDNLIISEGSGLSRKNKISPDQMLKILIEFMQFYPLLKHENNDFFKTGTLLNVRTRAGYIMGYDKRLYPYVIMINKKGKDCQPILENLILKVSQMTSTDH